MMHNHGYKLKRHLFMSDMHHHFVHVKYKRYSYQASMPNMLACAKVANILFKPDRRHDDEEA